MPPNLLIADNSPHTHYEFPSETQCRSRANALSVFFPPQPFLSTSPIAIAPQVNCLYLLILCRSLCEVVSFFCFAPPLLIRPTALSHKGLTWLSQGAPPLALLLPLAGYWAPTPLNHRTCILRKFTRFPAFPSFASIFCATFSLIFSLPVFFASLCLFH